MNFEFYITHNIDIYEHDNSHLHNLFYVQKTIANINFVSPYDSGIHIMLSTPRIKEKGLLFE